MIEDNLKSKRENMVNNLVKKGYIKSNKVIKAMKKVPRHFFVPTKLKKDAYGDRPLPIGENQTISAPHMVGILVERLELSGGEKVLEIGTGSGYNAAVISEVLDNGKVISIERFEDLSKNARKNLEKAGYGENIKLVVGDGSKGYKEFAPYDRVLITAASPEIPKPIENQTVRNGIIVAPIGTQTSQRLVIGKKEDGKIKKTDEGGCAFVPLKGKYGF